jgi:transposase
MEACPLSQWLHAGLSAAGFPVVLLEVCHVKVAISTVAVKTDRNDARGIAQLLRMSWYRPVHCKSQPAQDVRALLTARKQLLVKAIDVELCLRGLLRGYGLKLGQTTDARFAARVRELAVGHPVLEQLSQVMLRRALSCARRSPHCIVGCWRSRALTVFVGI